MVETHHRRRDRDAALALDRHPIRAHPPPLAARHFAADLPLRRPRLRAVQHADYLDHTGADAIDDDPGCAADDQLARQRNPPGTSHVRVIRELIDRRSNALHGIPDRGRVILGYVVRMLIEVTEGGAQPPNPRRGLRGATS